MPISIDESKMKRDVETVYIDSLDKQMDMRFYWRVKEREPHPSVTTVMGFGSNSGKKYRINDWRHKHYDSPLRLRYHQSIGTWMHWVLLHTKGDLPQSDEEEESKRDLKRMARIDDPHDTPDWMNELDEIPWWIEPFEGDDSEPYPEWVIEFDYNDVKAAEEFMKYNGTKQLLENENGAYEETEFVEKFVHHPTRETRYGTVGTYAGQADLVYVDENGDLVMCDVKTSDEIHEAYFSQLMAYKKALEYHGYDIDRCEILRVDPVTQSCELKRVPSNNEGVAWQRFVESRQTVERLCSFPDEPTDIDLTKHQQNVVEQ